MAVQIVPENAEAVARFAHKHRCGGCLQRGERKVIQGEVAWICGIGLEGFMCNGLRCGRFVPDWKVSKGASNERMEMGR